MKKWRWAELRWMEQWFCRLVWKLCFCPPPFQVFPVLWYTEIYPSRILFGFLCIIFCIYLLYWLRSPLCFVFTFVSFTFVSFFPFSHFTSDEIDLPPPIKKAVEGIFQSMHPCFGAVLLIRIRIIFPDPDPFLSVLGSGSVSYSIEHDKINWKGNFNKVCFLVGSWQNY